MISTLFWNIRGVRSKKAIHRLKQLANINKLVYIAIFEPFVDMSKIDGYRRFLGYHHCVASSNGKIWCFWNHMDHSEIIEDNEQQITLKMKQHSTDSGTFITAVYAKCTAPERRELWDSIDNLNNTLDGPWCIRGDFNVIMDPSEKVGGKPYRASKSLEFISIMETCGFMDIGFSGPRFTWCNNRSPRSRI